MNGLAAFLGVEGRLRQLDRRLKKQNPEPLADKIANFAEMEAALGAGPGGLDRFDLARTPNFEPRRGHRRAAGGGGAAGAAPSPAARGGARSRRCAAGSPGSTRSGTVVEGFTPRSLRQWKAARPGHLSFAVLRHPLAARPRRLLRADPAARTCCPRCGPT